MSELQRTVFYDRHEALGAKMVEFGGWEMPVMYSAGILEEHLAILTVREWLDLISDADIPVGPVYNLQQVVEDPHVKARGIIKEIEHSLGGKIKAVDNPIKMTRLEGEHQAPPTFSQHTEEILRKLLGYSDKEIKQLRKEQEENKEVLMSHLQKLK